MGLPVKPGWHEHKGVWLNTVHKALAPQTPAKLQIKETKIQILLNLSFWDGLMSDRLIKTCIGTYKGALIHKPCNVLVVIKSKNISNFHESQQKQRKVYKLRHL